MNDFFYTLYKFVADNLCTSPRFIEEHVDTVLSDSVEDRLTTTLCDYFSTLDTPNEFNRFAVQNALRATATKIASEVDAKGGHYSGVEWYKNAHDHTLAPHKDAVDHALPHATHIQRVRWMFKEHTHERCLHEADKMSTFVKDTYDAYRK